MTHRFRSALAACGLSLTFLVSTAALGPVLAGVAPGQARAADTAASAAALPPNSITINASGQVNVAPDMAIVTVGAQAIRPSAAAAQAAVNAIIAAALKNLRALRINDRRIQTATISLQPRYDNNSNLTGYQANQTLAVTANSLSEVGPIVDAGVSAGANNGVSVSYGLKDENNARLAALRQAIVSGRARAEAAAAALGHSLRNAHVQFTENSQSVPRPVVELGAQAARSADSGSTQSFGGTLTVRDDITLTYTF